MTRVHYVEPTPLALDPAPTPEPKRKPCRFCEQGYKLRHGGVHFIVKSILPAHIKIERCRALRSQEPAPGREGGGAVSQIVTKRGHIILVDADDMELVSGHLWYCCKSGQSRYASSKLPDGRIITMHRLILGAQPGQFVDHANRNGLDNRRANIRLCTKAENNRNRISTTGCQPFKGAAVHRASGLFHATISVGKRQISGGYFKTAREAAEQYDRMAIEHHGEFARTNKSLGLL